MTTKERQSTTEPRHWSDEAHGDFDRDVILAAARGALVEGKMQNQYYGPNDDPEPDDGCGDGGVVVP